jgi:serine kinase of HPr protein (carbohydrate metabolism regulator)
MASIHASAVLVGARAVLIRGPSGAGKSRLALSLVRAAETGGLAFALLVADDRTHLEPHHGRLLARPAPEIAGLIEVHGLGIRRLPHEPVAVVGLVVDLAAPDGERLPETASTRVTIEGIALTRLAVPAGADPLPLVLAALATPPRS